MFFLNCQPQDKDVAKLVEMGFTAEKSSSALRQVNGNVTEAINVLTLNTSESRDYRDSRDSRDSHDSRPGVMRGPPRGSIADKGEHSLMTGKGCCPTLSFGSDSLMCSTTV